MKEILQAMPDAVFTTDIMCGFVGETQADHEASLAFCEKIGFAKMHVFPYSKREGTAAARMPGHLPQAEKQRRAAEMIALDKKLERAHLQALVGSVQEVILETPQDGGYLGHTRGYAPVVVQGQALAPMQIVQAEIVSAEDFAAKGVAKG